MPPQIRVQPGDVIKAELINNILERLEALENKQKETKEKDADKIAKDADKIAKDADNIPKDTDKIAKDGELTRLPTEPGMMTDQPAHGRAFIRREERPLVGRRILDEPGELH
jgi:hypothetical protein